MERTASCLPTALATVERRKLNDAPGADSRYTIQGGDSTTVEERGLLPRSIDVVFNSIKGMESKANVGMRG